MESITHSTQRFLTIIVLAALLAGCAGTPKTSNSGADPYGVFYEGESEATYATAFPIASPEEAYRNGDTAVQAGDNDRALFEYIRGLRMADSADANVLYKIGGIHHARNELHLADMAYRWVLELSPQHAGAGTGLGLVLLQRHQYEAARLHLQSVAEQSSAVPWRAHNALGFLADMAADFESAEKHYREALLARPGSAVVLNNLGYSRYLAGNWEGARSALQEALRADAHYERAWRNMGLVYARQKNYDKALEALRRTGDEYEAYNDVGFVAMLEGDYLRALSFFEKAMELSPAFYATASENAENAKRMLSRGAVNQ